MGKRIKCPACGHEFRVHGAGEFPGQELVTCYECNTMFNHRKQSGIPEGESA